MTPLEESLAALPEGWERGPEARRAATYDDPVLFAITYLGHHLRLSEDDPRATFAEVHWAWYELIKEWMRPITRARQWRRAVVGPRSVAKSTIWFLIAPMWAAAHGHAKFVAAFADSGAQAELHLQTFRRELETNRRLRTDFPELCQPATGPRSALVANNRSMIIQSNDFVFAAKGADAASLGMKVGNRRPDLIILDDIEPDASNYSAYLAEKRLATLQNSILPLNTNARVIMSGTVTMAGSLIHQLVRTRQSTDDPEQWITDEAFEVSYWPAILVNDDGTERSIWPEKWPLEELVPVRHTRSFALNMMNAPVSDAGFWTVDDIEYQTMAAYPRTIISVDPAVTKKHKSDFTGIAVLSHNPRATRPREPKVYVRKAWKVKLSPRELRAKISAILMEFPEARVLLVETNQGGDTWADVFADLPVFYREVHQSIAKEDRALVLLNGYQKREVVHVQTLPDLETELLAFPTGLNDDLVDAVGSGYTYLTGVGLADKDKPKGRPSARSSTYA